MTTMADFTIEELMIFSVSVMGALGVLLSVIFRSKCKSIECCCIKCVRDVDAVIKDEKLQLGQTTSNPKKDVENGTDTSQDNISEPETEPLFNS